MTASQYVKGVGFKSLRHVAVELQLSESGLRKIHKTANLRFRAMVIGLHVIEKTKLDQAP
jgi:hypothetical protein